MPGTGPDPGRGACPGYFLRSSRRWTRLRRCPLSPHHHITTSPHHRHYHPARGEPVFCGLPVKFSLLSCRHTNPVEIWSMTYDLAYSLIAPVVVFLAVMFGVNFI